MGTGGKRREKLMSDFARGVVGVFVVGIVAGAGALMLIPKSSPTAAQVATVPAPSCAQHSGRKSDPACQKSTAQRDNGKTDAAAERILSSANSVATSGRTAAGLVTVDAQAIAALRRGETLQPPPAAEPTPAAAEPAAPATPAAATPPVAAVPAATGAPTRRVAARRAAPAHRTARQNAYRAYASTRNRGFAMGFPFFPAFR